MTNAAKVLLGIMLSNSAWAADWPMGRHDAGRTACTAEELAPDLKLAWSRELGPPAPAWAGERVMAQVSFDAAYEPVVAGQRLFVPSMVADSVAAYDLETGAELWRFFANGPVRLPPVAVGGRVYAGSDDGFLYCLDGATGSLAWKFRAAPRERLLIGNGRLISCWPIRGGPVFAGGKIIVASGAFPFMGAYVYALDPLSGVPVWTNSDAFARELVHPHEAVTLGGVTPQGPLAVVGDVVLVPNGRARPAAFDLRTGAFKYYNFGWSAMDGWSVCGQGGLFFVNNLAFHAETGEPNYSLLPERNAGTLKNAVLDGDSLIVASKGLQKFDLKSMPPRKLDDAKSTHAQYTKWMKMGGQAAVPVLLGDNKNLETVWLRAGSRLYASQGSNLLALSAADGAPSWRYELPEKPSSMLAANGKLVVSGARGGLYCFAETAGTGRHSLATSARASGPVELPGGQLHVAGGWAVVAGAAGESWCEALAGVRDLNVVVFDPDAARAAERRQRYLAEGLYGAKRAVVSGTPAALPPGIADVVVIGEAAFPDQTLSNLLEAVHPFGGRVVAADGKAAARVAKLVPASFRPVPASVTTAWVRVGGFPGAGEWTHENGDAARTGWSRDGLVKPPFSVQWFGAPSPDQKAFYRTKLRPARPQVAGGRVVVEWPGLLVARDLYTGRLLWKRATPPLAWDDGLKVNSLAGGRIGVGRAVTLHDSIYLHTGKSVERVDAATGLTAGTFPLDVPSNAGPGFLAVLDDVLVAGENAKPSTEAKTLMAKQPLSAAAAPACGQLVALERMSGKVLWRQKLEHAAVHNAIAMGRGRAFLLDRPADGPAGGRLLALDLRTGKVAWEGRKNAFGSWLAYSTDHDVLVQRVDNGGPPGFGLTWQKDVRLAACKGSSGEPLWEAKGGMNRPFIIHRDQLIPGNVYYKEPKAYDLLTGKATAWLEFPNQVMGRVCSGFLASDHIITLRSGTAAFADLDASSGLEYLSGFRSACTENLVPAGGVLVAPEEFSTGCTCAYPMQTSLAVVHDPQGLRVRPGKLTSTSTAALMEGEQ